MSSGVEIGLPRIETLEQLQALLKQHEQELKALQVEQTLTEDPDVKADCAYRALVLGRQLGAVLKSLPDHLRKQQPWGMDL